MVVEPVDPECPGLETAQFGHDAQCRHVAVVVGEEALLVTTTVVQSQDGTDTGGYDAEDPVPTVIRHQESVVPVGFLAAHAKDGVTRKRDLGIAKIQADQRAAVIGVEGFAGTGVVIQVVTLPAVAGQFQSGVDRYAGFLVLEVRRYPQQVGEAVVTCIGNVAIGGLVGVPGAGTDGIGFGLVVHAQVRLKCLSGRCAHDGEGQQGNRAQGLGLFVLLNGDALLCHAF